MRYFLNTLDYLTWLVWLFYFLLKLSSKFDIRFRILLHCSSHCLTILHIKVAEMLPAKKQRYKSTITNLNPEEKTVTLQDGSKIKYNKVPFSSFSWLLFVRNNVPLLFFPVIITFATIACNFFPSLFLSSYYFLPHLPLSPHSFSLSFILYGLIDVVYVTLIEYLFSSYLASRLHGFSKYFKMKVTYATHLHNLPS